MATPGQRPARALNDVELAELAGLGDRAAFGELARRHGPAVCGLLRRMGAEPGRAEAVARQAFVIAFANMAPLRGQGAFASRIRRLAARQFLVRRDARRNAAPAAEASRTSSPRALGDDALRPDVEVEAALDALAADLRLSLCLRWGAGLTLKEMAEAFSTTLEGVQGDLNRGLDGVRRRLGSSAPNSAVALERRLERALIEPFPGEDGAAFARGVERRLARVWVMRRLAIALAAASSAAVAVWRISDSPLATRLEATVRPPFALFARGTRSLALDLPLLRLLPVSPDVVWLLAGLVLLAAGLLAARLFDET